jgi:hypothetical protein
VGEPVVFDGGYSQASSPIVQYQWGFGDGVTADGMGVTHAFAAPGSYNVTLNVVDENGLSSSASHFIEIVAGAAVQPPAEQPTPEPAQPQVEQPTPEPPVAQPAPAQPPTAVIDGPAQVQAGAPVNFSSRNSQPGSSAIAQVQWGFGDGSADDQAEVIHTFPAAGQYQVTLTVIDENGLSHTAQLLVSAGPSQAELDAQAAAEAQRQAEEEAQRQAQEEAQRQAEQQAQQQAAEEAQRQAQEEAQRQAEEEAQRQAEEEAQRQAQEEAQRQAEEKARRQAEEAQRQAQEQEQQQQQDDASSDEGN